MADQQHSTKAQLRGTSFPLFNQQSAEAPSLIVRTNRDRCQHNYPVFPVILHYLGSADQDMANNLSRLFSNNGQLRDELF
ncbi:hypothetical protein D3C81_2100960 [compost metagenome]